MKNILSIAGSDPSGGAGIQADIKAISANGGYAMAVITALTAQNTQGVYGVQLVDPDFIALQINHVFSDIQVDAVKIGMLANSEIIDAVADRLVANKAHNIVLDPVMVAKGGDRLLAEEAVAALKHKLLPIADVITPNLPEAADLLGEKEATSQEEMVSQANQLQALGAKNIVLKGGHLNAEQSPDYILSQSGEGHWLDTKRIATKNTHGTGCTLSSTLATQITQHDHFLDAVKASKAYISEAIAHADSLNVGSGHGPVKHFCNTFKRH